MTTLDPAVQAQLQQIASGGLPPQAANALLQAGKINYAQYADATGVGAAPTPAAPAAAPAAPPNATDADTSWMGAPSPLGPQSGANADPGTANMSPDQIAAQQRAAAGATRPAAPGVANAQGPGPLAFAPPEGPGAGAVPSINLAGLSAPGKVLPAAWVPQHRQTQTEGGVAFSPETQAALQKAAAAGDAIDPAQQQAIDAQQRYDQAKARLDANQQQGELDEYQVRKNKQDSEREWQMNQVTSAMRDMQEAQAKGVDPHHWYANQSTGSKIAMAIGLIAGGFNQGSGRTSSNVALDQMNKEIDRDVDAQKENIAGKEKSFQNQVSMYGLLRQKGLDEDQSRDGAKLLAHQALDAQLKAAMPEASNAMAKLQLQKSIQDNQERIAKLRGAFDEKAGQKVTSSTADAYRPAQVGQVTPQAILKKAQELYEKNLGKGGNDWNQSVRLATRALTGRDVAPGAAEPIITEPPKGGASALGRLAKPLMESQANAADLQRLQKLTSQTYLSPAEKAEANTLAANLGANGVAGLPQDIGSLDLGRMTGSQPAAVQAAASVQAARIKAAQNIAAAGGGAAPAEDDTPAGFEE